VARSLHASIHKFQVDGESHFAAATVPSVPEALADVVDGFIGLDDFRLQPQIRQVEPKYNGKGFHALTPEDYATIYNIAPLYQAGFDGTGQSIMIVGESDVQLSDLRAFRTRYNLPANDPKMILYNGVDPGYNGAEIEGNLDLEWAGAIAPKATVYYVYGSSAFTALVASVNFNLAPILSVSYGGCEVGYRTSFYRSIGQQANAQGITILSASGDAGAASCDQQGSEMLATRGMAVLFPAVLPEVTAVGGTQFVESSGNYWASTNSPNFGSALSYIPEAAWNESGVNGLLASGGGTSLYYPRPSWQNGSGLPNDNARHVPDVALSAAAINDPYALNYLGSNTYVGGTSASTPSMAGILALLNQYVVAKGFQTQPGLGNINPQLYRLAQATTTPFHDIASGNNIVPCSQGSPDCLAGSFGYSAGTGYDMATGLGSVDANSLVTQWNTRASAVSISLVLSATRVTVNDTISASAVVNGVLGSSSPTGAVQFSVGGVPLGSTLLTARSGQLGADFSFPAYLAGGTGTFALVAQYSGDASFSGGGATKNFQVTVPIGASAIIPGAPSTVWPLLADAQGLSWQTTLTLREAAGVPAQITGFTIDGIAQPLAQYYPSPQIPASTTVSATVIFRNITAPSTRNFGFTGVDAGGQSWSRQILVNYFPLPLGPNFTLTATPLTVPRNTSADPGCQWPVQVTIDDTGGYANLISAMFVGGVDVTAQVPAIFGTNQLDAWDSLQGTVCVGSPLTPPASEYIEVDLSGGNAQEVQVTFSGPPAAPAKVTATPSSVGLNSTGPAQPAQATLAVTPSDKSVAWTAQVFPANRTTAWLTVSQLSGTGPAQLNLTANGAGFEPGAYRAQISIQSASMTQPLNIPVTFVMGASTSGATITSVSSPATNLPGGSPGMLLAVYGTKLSSATFTATANDNPLPYTSAGVTATINNMPVPLLYVSPTQINLQVPYTVGSGAAILGINNNGQIASFPLTIVPSVPGIFADESGNLAPSAVTKAGGTTTLFVTGVGVLSSGWPSGYAPFAGTSIANLPKPLLPLSVTVGGIPAFIQFAGIPVGLIGTAQLNLILPASVPSGKQPVIVTVNGVSSPPVTLTVQ
jgi:uncharacterized protein (TIGR03437 family)